MRAQGLSQTYADTLIGDSVSAIPCEPSSVDTAEFLVASLTRLAPKIFPPHLVQNSSLVSISHWVKPFLKQLC